MKNSQLYSQAKDTQNIPVLVITLTSFDDPVAMDNCLFKGVKK